MIHLFKILAVAAVCMVASLTVSAYDFEVDGFQYTILSEAEKTCEVSGHDESISGDIAIPQQANGYAVTAIGESFGIFSDALTGVEILKGVTVIGNRAFSNMRNLRNVVLPEGLISIGSSAFEGCVVLENIKIPNSVTAIGDYAFSGCDAFTMFVIPAGVTTIGKAVVGGRNLEEIVVESGNPNFATYDGGLYDKDLTVLNSFPTNKATVEFPETVVTIGLGAFSYCINLTSVTLPKSVRTLEERAFSFAGLTSISLPEGLSFIGDMAFQGTYLTSVTLPASLVEIGFEAFYWCQSLSSVTSLAITPPSAKSNTFEYIAPGAILYVPSGSVEVYKAADVWKNFYKIEEFAPTAIEVAAADGQLAVTADGSSLIVEGAEGLVSVYSAGGALVTRVGVTGGRAKIALPGHGLYVIKVGGAVRKVSM